MTFKIESPNETLTVSCKNKICWLTLNRPQSLNALTEELVDALTHVTEDIKHRSEIGAVVLMGKGDHFMAGGDIKSFKHMMAEETNKDKLKEQFKVLIESFHSVILNLQGLPQPVLASVRGAVAGAGVSLMSACDLVIASKSSFFTLAYCNLGTSPDGGSTYFLPRIVGLKRSFEIALLGERFDVQTAENWGLINKTVSDENLVEETEKLALKLASGPLNAHSKAKTLLYSSSHNSLANQLNQEAESFSTCAITKDFKEGVEAFIDKRSPKFTGK